MKGQGEPWGPVKKVDWEVDSDIVQKLEEMERYSEMSIQNLVHIALRRFISAHKDYLVDSMPPLDEEE
jgi:hypothetical protein